MIIRREVVLKATRRSIKHLNKPSREEVLKATRKSIKHWCIDIKRPLMKGRTISNAINTRLLWDDKSIKDKDVVVPVGTTSCALCRLFYRERNCKGCPLALLGDPCVKIGSTYSAFFRIPTLVYANIMIARLIEAYRDYGRKNKA